MLEAIRYVDLVIPEENWDQKKTDVEKYHADIFVIGDDWKGAFDFLRDQCEVVYLSRTPEISTTKTKQSFTPDWQLPENGPRQLFQALNRPIHPASPLPIVHIASHMHKRNIIN